MTGPPKSLLSERSAPRLQIERGVCLLENPSPQLSASANGLVPGSASVAHTSAVWVGGLAPPAMCVGAKATLEIQHNERCAPPRGQARRTEQYRPSSIHRRNKLGAMLSLIGDGTQLSPCPTPVSAISLRKVS
jgi:hypothetical protein